MEIISKKEMRRLVAEIYREIGRDPVLFLPVMEGARPFADPLEKAMKEKGMEVYRSDIKHSYDNQEGFTPREIITPPEDVENPGAEIAIIFDDDAHVGRAGTGCAIWMAKNSKKLGIKKAYLAVDLDACGIAHFARRRSYNEWIGVDGLLKRYRPDLWQEYGKEIERLFPRPQDTPEARQHTEKESTKLLYRILRTFRTHL